MTLTDFLLARIAEDECAAQTPPVNASYQDPVPSDCWDPSRVLAECERDRQIVALHYPHEHHGEHGDYVFCDACQWDYGDDSPRIDMGIEEFGKPCPTLRALAMVYADHPDYREEWKP